MRRESAAGSPRCRQGHASVSAIEAIVDAVGVLDTLVPEFSV